MIVTIAIINHNYARYLPVAINSALSQNHPDVQVDVLVVDDASTDDSLDVTSSFTRDGKVRLSTVPQCMGFGASLERAMREASGDWVMLLDADDWFSEDKLKVLLPHLRSNLHYISNYNTFVSECGTPSGHIGSPGNTSTLTVRRSVALDVMPVGDESGFYILYLAGHGRIVDSPLTYHRIHKSSMAADPAKEFERRSNCYNSVVSKLKLFAKKRPDWLTAEKCRRAIAEFESMSTFASTEANIHRGQRTKAVLTALSRITVCNSLSEWLRTLVRAVILRPVPCREDIYIRNGIE